MPSLTLERQCLYSKVDTNLIDPSETGKDMLESSKWGGDPAILLRKISFLTFSLTQGHALILIYIMNPGANPERICEFSKFQCEKMSATMVGPQIKFLVLDELKQSKMHFRTFSIV